MLDQSFNDLMDLPQQLLDKVDVNPASGCWEWNSYRLKTGYGRVTFKGVSQIAHRLIYKLIVGPIPPGLDLHHVCRNKGCVNPRHVMPLIRKAHLAEEDHSTKGIREREKTHCPKGHEYAGDNLYVHNGKRGCKACRSARQKSPERKEWVRQYYLKKKARV